MSDPEWSCPDCPWVHRPHPDYGWSKDDTRAVDVHRTTLCPAVNEAEEEFSPFPPHLSPSQISSLLTCGEQFRLTRLLRVPQRPMWAGIGGSVVHKLTEELDRAWYEDRHGSSESDG